MQLAELTQAGGYQGIAYSEFLYWSSLAARPGGSNGVRAQLTGVTVVRVHSAPGTARMQHVGMQ